MQNTDPVFISYILYLEYSNDVTLGYLLQSKGMSLECCYIFPVVGTSDILFCFFVGSVPLFSANFSVFATGAFTLKIPFGKTSSAVSELRLQKTRSFPNVRKCWYRY